MDYVIWGALQQRVYYYRKFYTIEELKRTINDIYNKRYHNIVLQTAICVLIRQVHCSCVTLCRIVDY